MANWNDIAFAPLQADYIDRLNALLSRSQAVATEVETARGGQSDVLTRIQQCMVMSIGFTQDVNANGFRIRNAPAPLYGDELVNKTYADAIKTYADGLSFSSALPAQPGNAGKEITTDGSVASWGASSHGSLAILNSLGYFGS